MVKTKFTLGVVGDLLNNVLVKEIMASPVVTISVQEDFSEVEELFLNKRIRHLPVVDHNRLVGIITQRDLYRVISP